MLSAALRPNPGIPPELGIAGTSGIAGPLLREAGRKAEPREDGRRQVGGGCPAEAATFPGRGRAASPSPRAPGGLAARELLNWIK